MINKLILAIVAVPHFIILFIPIFVLALIYLILSGFANIFGLYLTEKYLFNISLVLDQVGNAIAGGDPDETVSSRAGKLRDKRRWACILCYILDKLDPNHCAKTEEADEGSRRTVE